MTDEDLPREVMNTAGNLFMVFGEPDQRRRMRRREIFENMTKCYWADAGGAPAP
ncbi:MAG: hypothetical protein ACM3U2_21340 [Deltaproteobacteria bacterium]